MYLLNVSMYEEPNPAMCFPKVSDGFLTVSMGIPNISMDPEMPHSELLKCVLSEQNSFGICMSIPPFLNLLLARACRLVDQKLKLFLLLAMAFHV